MTRRLLIGLLLATTGLWSSFALAQDEREIPPPAPGLVDAVARGFTTADGARYPLWSVQIRLAEFEDAESASAAITPWFGEVTSPAGSSTYDTSELYPVAVETIADETRAIAGMAVFREDDDYELHLAVLVVRDGTLLHVYAGWAERASPLDELVAIAERTLGLAPPEFDPVPDVGYSTGGLYDLMPRIEHLPQGMTWVWDYAPCAGVFGASPCPDPGTPLAEATPVTG